MEAFICNWATILGFVVSSAGLIITICSFYKIKNIDERMKEKKILMNIKEQIPKGISLLDNIIQENLLEGNNVEYNKKLKELLYRICSWKKEGEIVELAQEMINTLNSENVSIDYDKLIKIKIKLEEEKLLIED